MSQIHLLTRMNPPEINLMAWIENASYENERVQIDGKSYRDCTFTDVTLVYSAGILPIFENCTFNNIQLDFSAEADNTLLFLSGLYRGGFAHSVEAIFDAIRN
ncbi:MAG: hypothetical protein ACFE0Q_13280 [Anaerolineae bacterium]